MTPAVEVVAVLVTRALRLHELPSLLQVHVVFITCWFSLHGLVSATTSLNQHQQHYAGK